MGWRNTISWLLAAASLLCPVICGTEVALHAEVSHEAANCPDRLLPESPATPHHDHDSSGAPVPHTEHTCFCTSGVPASSTFAVHPPSMAPGLPTQALINPLMLDRLGRFIGAPCACPDPIAEQRIMPLLI